MRSSPKLILAIMIFNNHGLFHSYVPNLTKVNLGNKLIIYIKTNCSLNVETNRIRFYCFYLPSSHFQNYPQLHKLINFITLL